MVIWCDEYDIELCEWPGYSPDFNAIELIQNIIKQKVKNKNPKSQDELENPVDEAFDGISLNVIQACIKKTHKIYQQFASSYQIFICLIDTYIRAIHVYPRKLLLIIKSIFQMKI